MQAPSSQRAYDYIRDQLLQGRLAPGTQLVNRTLAQEIGVSVVPVREAISRLSSEGLITHVSGAGAYVRKPDRQELVELFGLRDALETYAAAEAARCITEGELAELEAICTGWRKVAARLASENRSATSEEQTAWVDQDLRFHAILISAARNRWLSKTVNEMRLTSRIFTAVRREPSMITPTSAKETHRTHAALVAALGKRDADEARKWMSVQIRQGLRSLLEALDRHEY
jgi:DNA-binding GntR family transcriptional regulator